MREALLRDLPRRLEAHDDVVTAWLFGSVARGSHGSRSDVDVAVLLAGDESETPERVVELQDELTSALGVPVQVVAADAAPVDLVHRILRDGVLLVDGDPSRRIAFEVRSRNEFWDLEPYLLRYRGLERRRA